jgi:hypothetical protein
MRLTGDRNQCPTCCQYFNSTAAFDKHRTGPLDGNRLCLTEPAMKAKGMQKNTSGFWVTRLMSEDAVSKVSMDAN